MSLMVAAPQEAEREAGLGLLPAGAGAPAGARCLRARGLGPAQVARFSNASHCLGRRIGAHMGVGGTARMVSDYILAPGRWARAAAGGGGFGFARAQPVEACVPLGRGGEVLEDTVPSSCRLQDSRRVSIFLSTLA
jgi:hypothetical protein